MIIDKNNKELYSENVFRLIDICTTQLGIVFCIIDFIRCVVVQVSCCESAGA
jgi:hypothetical protein